MGCNSRGLAWNCPKLWICHYHHQISLPWPWMALTWRSSCTLRGLLCENGLQYANFRVKCIFVVITRNTITSAKQHLQRLKRSHLKAIKTLSTIHCVQLGSRLVFVRKIAPFGISNHEFSSQIYIQNSNRCDSRPLEWNCLKICMTYDWLYISLPWPRMALTWWHQGLI